MSGQVDAALEESRFFDTRATERNIHDSVAMFDPHEEPARFKCAPAVRTGEPVAVWIFSELHSNLHKDRLQITRLKSGTGCIHIFFQSRGEHWRERRFRDFIMWNRCPAWGNPIRYEVRGNSRNQVCRMQEVITCQCVQRGSCNACN